METTNSTDDDRHEEYLRRQLIGQLVALRKRKGISGKKMAAILDVHPSTISRFETKCDPEMGLLRAYARALGGSIVTTIERREKITPADLKGVRIFVLHRKVDHSGNSGVGDVAMGVVWPDGGVTIRWAGETPSTVVWLCVEDAIRIHGHNGDTEFIEAVDVGGRIEWRPMVEQLTSRPE